MLAHQVISAPSFYWGQDAGRGKNVHYLLLSLSYLTVIPYHSADFWAAGCIIFHMIAGVQPFKALTSYLSMEKTKKAEYEVPQGFDPSAQDLIAKFFVIEPSQRLGDIACGGPLPIKEHPFFSSVDWTQLWTLDPPRLEAGLVKKIIPPIKRGPPSDAVFDDEDDGNSSSSSDAEVVERSAAWAALVRDLSEDEMDDDRSPSYAQSTDDGRESTQSDHDSDTDRDTVGDPNERRETPLTSDVPFPEAVEEERGRSLQPSALSPPLASEASDHKDRLSLAGEIRAWDTQYPKDQVPDVQTGEIARARLSGGGSPVSSSGTSSTGRSDGLGHW